MPRSRALVGGCWHRGLGDLPCPVAAQDGRSGQQRCSARLQDVDPPFCLVHAVPPGVQACGIQAHVHPWELGFTDTILPQYCMLQRSSAFWLFCSLCHELRVEGKGKKGPHRGFPLP